MATHPHVVRLSPSWHIVIRKITFIWFSTKDRAKLIAKELQPRLWAYVAAICKNKGMLAFAVGGMTDHIHVLFRLPPTITLVRAVTLIKSNSSKWIRKKDRKFAWQEGYGAFSVSSSGIDKVIRYIDEQEQRHRKFTFEHEFITLLKKQGIPFDPKNIFG